MPPTMDHSRQQWQPNMALSVPSFKVGRCPVSGNKSCLHYRLKELLQTIHPESRIALGKRIHALKGYRSANRSSLIAGVQMHSGGLSKQ